MVHGLSGSALQAYEQDDAMTYGDRDTTPYYGEFQSYTAHYGRAVSQSSGAEKVGAIFMAAISLAGDIFRGLGYILGGGDWKIQPSFFKREVQPVAGDPAMRTLIPDTVTEGGARHRRASQPE